MLPRRCRPGLTTGLPAWQPLASDLAAKRSEAAVGSGWGRGSRELAEGGG